MINKRVNMDGCTGTVTEENQILIDNDDVTVYDVKWDGNPTNVPLKYSDENGTSKRGYLAKDLNIVS